MTPSNANTSGLTQDLCERLDAILVEESPMHPFGCATWEEASRIAIDMAKEVIVTAASAQARIAEEKAKAFAEQQAAIEENRLRLEAEARADRLAKALEFYAEADLYTVIDRETALGHDDGSTARAALQQETQP